MSLPRWVVFVCAFWVLLWGGYRICLGVLALRRQGRQPERPSFRKKGLFARSPRAHIAYGLVFVLFGVYLTAMGFGYYFTFDDFR